MSPTGYCDRIAKYTRCFLSVKRNCTVMNEQSAHRIWVWIWKSVIHGYDKATARQLKVSLIISSVHWKICMYKVYWFYFTLIWRSLWTPTVKKLSWHFSVLENMHVLDKSAALVYITNCNQVIGLILVIITCHIYVFDLRTILWRKFSVLYQGRNYAMCTRPLLLLLIQCKLRWTCLEHLLR